MDNKMFEIEAKVAKILMALDEEVYASEGCECCGGGYTIEGKDKFLAKVEAILKEEF